MRCWTWSAAAGSMAAVTVVAPPPKTIVKCFSATPVIEALKDPGLAQGLDYRDDAEELSTAGAAIEVVQDWPPDNSIQATWIDTCVCHTDVVGSTQRLENLWANIEQHGVVPGSGRPAARVRFGRVWFGLSMPWAGSIFCNQRSQNLTNDWILRVAGNKL